MGKKSPSPPPPPDPVETANAQASANKETAVAQSLLNMVDQYTPNGSLTYSQIDTHNGVPRFSVEQKLTPDGQRILDQSNKAAIGFGETANAQLDRVRDLLGRPYNLEGLPAAPVANEATRSSVRDSLLGRLEPQFNRDREALEARLANQGISLGSSAYGTAIDELNRSRNDARLAADVQAGGEMSRVYELEANARDRAVNERLQERQIPLNELIAMVSGTQVQQPNFTPTPQTQIGQTPVADSIYASYNGQLNNYNQQVAQKNAFTQGLFSLIGSGAGAYAANPAAFAFSDRRLKKHVLQIGELASGLGVYVFKYLWSDDWTIGCMADEVKQVFPSAVKSMAGFDAVDYGRIA